MSAGRKRSFDEEQALEAAMRIFWHQGYAGTSLSDLTEALGISKPSLYAAFGNKEQLFARALVRYGRHYGLPHAEKLLEPRDATLRQRLRTYLASVARMLTDPALPGGCLIALSSCEAGGGNLPQQACTTLAGVRGETRRVLAEVFSRERTDGQLGPDRDPDVLARYVMTLMMGMAVMARSGARLDDLEPVIGMAVELV
jgi:AcrR family transcriptional regulator